MFLTPEIVKKTGACEAGVKWMERYFPEGGELKDIISHERCPRSFLYWGHNHFLLNKNEDEAYQNRLHIDCEKPQTVSNSRDIINSECVFMGKEITNSSQIHSSNEVADSHIIQASKKVGNSIRVFDSKEVEGSMNVYVSNNIINSQNIVYSSQVFNSSNVLKGKEVSNSFYVVGTNEIAKNIKDSYFISNSNNLSHCLFCDNIDSAQYLLFNQPITEQEYDVYVEQLKKLKKDWSPAFLTPWGSEQLPLLPPMTRTENYYCKDIPEQLILWIKTLPNFDEQTLFNILKR